MIYLQKLKPRKTNKKPTKKPRPPDTIWHRRWLKWVIFGLLGVLILTQLAPIINPIFFPPVKKVNFGVSFSAEQAKYLDLDWKQNYVALLDNMKVKNFRLMSYWDIGEATRGQFDFTDLDWQVTETAKRGATVSLAIGIRQPHWPECHEPSWATQLSGNTWKQALYAYMEQVVKRYEPSKTLISWQLENEAMNNAFGTCPPADRQRLVEEFALVKSLSHKPVWMSLSDQAGLPLNAPVPDRYGFSVYRIVHGSPGGYNGYFLFPTPIWYHNVREATIKMIQHRDMFIHELQLEPWGPDELAKLSIKEQNKSMSLQQLKDNMLFARELGMSDIYGWGSEWWYWRKVKFDDPSMWNEMKHQIETLKP